ncbi:MAG: NAD-dependent epimerase/dehydratase family protein [Isosphaeraceae bacterium]|nr:NAD-dependent epimerase/dehydratase family protein [Isosphaeraceae bacterium]
MTRWLVTGGTGFLGTHLLKALEPRGDEVIALGRRAVTPAPSARFHEADLDDPVRVRAAIAEIRPTIVLHAAGRTPPADAYDLYRGNTMATVHLLDALRALDQPVRVVLAGSAAELGPVPCEHLPVAEDYPCRPADAYGLSKFLATSAGLAARPPLEVLVARVFNPIGPGLPATQAFGRFAERLCAGESDPLTMTVGDLDARRDFIDIRDVARAFLALADRGRPGLVYHVGTGGSRRVGDGLDELIRLSGRAVRVVMSPALAGRGGPSDSRADIGRIVAHTGWQPQVAFERSLAELFVGGVEHNGAFHGPYE